jgi:hypothetical protein
MRQLLRFCNAALCIAVASVIATIGSAHRAAAAATTTCATSGLVVWLNTEGDHAAGSSYYKLGFTNLSGQTCTLQGFPGVSALGIRGRQLGRPAARTHTGTPRQIRLANKATAVAVLRVVNVHNFPPASCRPVGAAAFRVYPPNQTASRNVPFPVDACSRGGPVFLFVRAVQKA